MILRKLRFGYYLILVFALTIVSCSGVHNDPPAEIIRMSGAGPSAPAGTAGLISGEAETVEEEGVPTAAEGVTQRRIVLDSSGNPISK